MEDNDQQRYAATYGNNPLFCFQYTASFISIE